MRLVSGINKLVGRQQNVFLKFKLAILSKYLAPYARISLFNIRGGKLFNVFRTKLLQISVCPF